MQGNEQPFGPAWRATMHDDGKGLQHRPPGVRPTPRYTERQRGELLRITDQADALVATLRRRTVAATAYDPRLARIAGKSFARLLRRVWVGKQPYTAAKS